MALKFGQGHWNSESETITSISITYNYIVINDIYFHIQSTMIKVIIRVTFNTEKNRLCLQVQIEHVSVTSKLAAQPVTLRYHLNT